MYSLRFLIFKKRSDQVKIEQKDNATPVFHLRLDPALLRPMLDPLIIQRKRSPRSSGAPGRPGPSREGRNGERTLTAAGTGGGNNRDPHDSRNLCTSLRFFSSPATKINCSVTFILYKDHTRISSHKN
jgi:hypothetical protein